MHNEYFTQTPKIKPEVKPMTDQQRDNFAQYTATMRRMVRGTFQMWGSHNDAWRNYFAEKHNVIY